MFPYIPNTLEETNLMMKTIGVDSIGQLFSDIPENLKLKNHLQLEKGLSELEVTKKMQKLAAKNICSDEATCFLGAGVYDHYIPSVVKHLIGRSEFYTAYTPYQPEISQGTLQGIFEYETMMCSLTGMDVSNSSMYDGSTALVEAAIMSTQATRRSKILVSSTVHPDTRRVLKTYLKLRGIELEEIKEKDGVTDESHLEELVSSNVAGVIIQSPNFFGIIEDIKNIEKLTHKNKALLILSVDPISLGVLKSPRELGADIAVGEAQALGINMNFGGAFLGFLCTTTKLMRKMPGRIVGQTLDVDGKRGFVLTLQAREQHIRREKATSNICSDETLNSIGAAIYLSTLGKKGVKEVGENCILKSHYAYESLINTGKYKKIFNKPFFKEFVIRGEEDVDYINEKLLEKKIIGGFNIEKSYENYDKAMMLCVTEKRTRKEIDDLVKAMEEIQ